MKNFLCLLLVICMLFSLAGCSYTFGSAYLRLLVALGNDRADKDDIFEFVCENEEALLNAIDDGDYAAFENQGFIKEIDVNDTVVDFPCGGAGMGSGTSYVGFYYTPDDDMTAIWCAPTAAASLVPAGDGFEWLEKKGDNRYYTEKICENFYYYEASF